MNSPISRSKAPLLFHSSANKPDGQVESENRSDSQESESYFNLPRDYSAILYFHHRDQETKIDHYLLKLGKPFGYIKSNTQQLEKKNSYSFDPRLISLEAKISNVENSFYDLRKAEKLGIDPNQLFIALDVYDDFVHIYLVATKAQTKIAPTFPSDLSYKLIDHTEIAVSKELFDHVLSKHPQTKDKLKSLYTGPNIIRNREFGQFLFDYLLAQGIFDSSCSQ